MSFEGGPYVQAACICDQVIEDKTGVMSLIRIVDNLTHMEANPSPPEIMPPVHYRGKLVLMLKSGKAIGRYNLKVQPELPTGETLDPIVITAHFEGEEKGINVVTDLNFTFELEGLYWFNIYIDEDFLTGIPFRVRYNRVVVGSSSESE